MLCGYGNNGLHYLEIREEDKGSERTPTCVCRMWTLRAIAHYDFCQKVKTKHDVDFGILQWIFFEEFLAANDEQLSLTFLYKIPSKTTHV